MFSRTFISGFGYFPPQKKYKLDFTKKMYTPSSTDKPKVIFTDSAKSNPKTPAEIAKERNRSKIIQFIWMKVYSFYTNQATSFYQNDQNELYILYLKIYINSHAR